MTSSRSPESIRHGEKAYLLFDGNKEELVDSTSYGRIVDHSYKAQIDLAAPVAS